MSGSNGSGSAFDRPRRTARQQDLIVDEHAERAVLGAVLINGEAKLVVVLQARGLRPEHFYWQKHRDVFAAMVSLAKQKNPVDPILVAAELLDQRSEELEELTGYVPVAGNYLEYGARVTELALWRARQTASLEMAQAVSERNPNRWQTAARRLREFAAEITPVEPEPEPEPKLRLVTEGMARTFANIDTGEKVPKPKPCESCKQLDRKWRAAEKNVRTWQNRYFDFEETKEARARESGLWMNAEALFEIWRELTGRRKAKFTGRRFELVDRFLSRYGISNCERAIAGIAHDHQVRPCRNGQVEHVNYWETVFKDSASFARYFQRAPRDWEPTLVDRTELTEPEKLAVKQRQEQQTDRLFDDYAYDGSA